MQITLVEAEILEAIEQYVSGQINVAEGQKITVDLKAQFNFFRPKLDLNTEGLRSPYSYVDYHDCSQHLGIELEREDVLDSISAIVRLSNATADPLGNISTLPTVQVLQNDLCEGPDTQSANDMSSSRSIFSKAQV